jgi:hypothetical protein
MPLFAIRRRLAPNIPEILFIILPSQATAGNYSANLILMPPASA